MAQKEEKTMELEKKEDDKIKELEEQLKAANLKNSELEKKIKFAPENIKLPKEQANLPKGIQDSQIKTVVRDMTAVISEKMAQLKDLATMEIMLDTPVRMKNRLNSIKELSSAQHIKVRGMWKTTAPKMHITKLEGKKISNDECEISFGVYETDENGDKVIFTNYADVTMFDGSTIKRALSAEYKVAYEVVERIKTGKPITREVVRINGI